MVKFTSNKFLEKTFLDIQKRKEGITMSDIQENSCAFYASDYHLEMIMLPYINENLKNDKTVYVFTEHNLEDTINTLLSRVI